MTDKSGWHFLLFLENCPIAIGSGSFPIKAFSMAGRLAVLALLLVCVVWGAWLNFVATARVDEGEVQIKLFFQAFSSPNYTWFSTLFFSVAALAVKMFSTIISAITDILKKTLRGRNVMKYFGHCRPDLLKIAEDFVSPRR